ncbi:MAG: LysR family transcriptional regulator [Bifidobacteriaceae bacterium]|jgi:DNA-binding transcriptional LysR family regulator|nr:LysR family transcriptional regulator [Bifidobacteriaceae bacterium]
MTSPLDVFDTFIAVYEARQFMAAAAQLHVSQSTVSDRIAALEKQVGHRLFERSPRRDVTPTAAGERLYSSARTMSAEWHGALADIDTDATAREPFRILTSHTATHVVLPQVLLAVVPWLGKLSVSAATRNSDEIFAAVSSREIEFGIIEKPLSDESVIRSALLRDQLVHAGRRDQPWLVREEGSGVRYYTDVFFRRMERHPANVIEISSNEAICRTLESGCGQSIVSQASIADSVPREELDSEFTRTFYALAPRSGLSRFQRKVVAETIDSVRKGRAGDAAHPARRPLEGNLTL